MSEKNTLSITIDEDSDSIFEKTLLFSNKNNEEIGVVTKEMLFFFKKKGFVFSPQERDALFMKGAKGVLIFKPQDQLELDKIKEWQKMPHNLQMGILEHLWLPTHLNEKTFEEICSNSDLLESSFLNVHKAVLEGAIRFKEGTRRIKPVQSPRTGSERKKATEFHALMGEIEKTYIQTRTSALNKKLGKEIFSCSSEVSQQAFEDFSHLQLECILSAKLNSSRKELVERYYRNILIDKLVDKLMANCPEITEVLNLDIDQQIHKKSLFVRTQLLAILRFFDLKQLIVLAEQKDSKAQVKGVLEYYRKKVFCDLPDKMREILGENAPQVLSLNMLQLLESSIEEDEQIESEDQVIIRKSHKPSFFDRLLGRQGKQNYRQIARTFKRLYSTLDVVAAIGHQYIEKISFEKLEILLQNRDEVIIENLKNGFNRFLPHTRQDYIVLLGRIYNSSSWEIVKEFRFLNTIDREILVNLEDLIAKDLIDVSFARLLAKTYKQKIKFLKFYHIDEVGKKQEVIQFFKDSFLKLKKGMVRLVSEHLKLIKEYKEVIPFLFKLKPTQLSYYLADRSLLGVFLTVQRQDNRKIIYAEAGTG